MRYGGFRLKNSGYILLVVFVIVMIAGLVVRNYNKDLWGWFSAFDTASAVALAILAFWGYVEYAKGEDEIELIFDVEGKREPTGLTILRKNFTRSEIGGVLGFIQKDQEKKFRLKYLKTKKFLKDVHIIQKGKNKEFVIPMSEKERDQFEL